VIGANESGAVALLVGDDFTATMRATIVERLNVAAFRVGNQGRYLARVDLLDDKVASMWKLLDPPGNKPGATENPISFQGKEFRRSIRRERNRSSLQSGMYGEVTPTGGKWIVRVCEH
jgi:hypothetical protein